VTSPKCREKLTKNKMEKVVKEYLDILTPTDVSIFISEEFDKDGEVMIEISNESDYASTFLSREYIQQISNHLISLLEQQQKCQN
jgi:Mg/Co/Ni transporter MgtE